MVWASVCPSVCHTRDLYQNGASSDDEICTSGCFKVSSFTWQNFVPLGKGVSLERGRQKEVPPLKRRYFAVIGSYSVKTIADKYTDLLLIITSTGDRHFRLVNVDDLERPWTLQKGFLVNFSQFLDAAHISTLNCDEMAVDRPKHFSGFFPVWYCWLYSCLLNMTILRV